MSSKAHATYTLTGSEDDTNVTLVGDVDHDSSSIFVDLQWQKPRSLLEKPNLDAVANLRIRVVPGDDKMSSFQLFNQLCALRGFCSGLQGEGIQWRGREDEEETSLEEDLWTLFEAVKHAGPRGLKRIDRTGVEEDKDQMDEIVIASRQDMDFTDLLWNVLRKVESFSELCMCLKQILLKIKEEELRPFVSREFYILPILNLEMYFFRFMPRTVLKLPK